MNTSTVPTMPIATIDENNELNESSKINDEIVRYFFINNLKTKSGKDKKQACAYTVAYSYDPSIGRVRYGACKFTRTDNKDTFSKKSHRATAGARYSKYPIYFDICFDDSAPSRILHEVRTTIKKMIFTVGMKCRHRNDAAMNTQPFPWELKYNLKDGTIIRHKVTLIPQNRKLTLNLPDSPTPKKIEWVE